MGSWKYVYYRSFEDDFGEYSDYLKADSSYYVYIKSDSIYTIKNNKIISRNKFSQSYYIIGDYLILYSVDRYGAADIYCYEKSNYNPVFINSYNKYNNNTNVPIRINRFSHLKYKMLHLRETDHIYIYTLAGKLLDKSLYKHQGNSILFSESIGNSMIVLKCKSYSIPILIY